MGLSRHIVEIEALLRVSPETTVVIDHCGFFLQPAVGVGDDRSLDEDSWKALLKLSSFPQVHVKVSALFRLAMDPWPFASLSTRLTELLKAYGSDRLFWGSDFPYATEHSEYAAAVLAVEEWPAWKEMAETDRANLVSNT